MKRTVLVTGASGFIGTNFSTRSSDFFIREADLLLVNPADIDFSGVASVLHLAAVVHRMEGAPEDLYFSVNRDLALATALAAKKNGVGQFILMSTAKVYGESSTGMPAFNENSACEPVDAYGKSKLEAEKAVLSLASDEFRVAVVRSPLVYGPGVRANMLNLVKLIDKVPLPPLGGIRNRRTMVYIGNLVALYRKIIERNASGIFIAGDGNAISTTELASLISASLGKRGHILAVPGFLQDIIKTIKPAVAERLFGSFELDTSGTEERLGFKAPFTVAQGISDMIEWYRSNGGK